MRKLTLLVSSLTLVLLFAGSVKAVSPNNPNLNRIQEKQALQDAKQNDIKDKIAEKKASQAAKLTQIKIRVAEKFYNHLKIRLNAAILRLDRLISRIEARIAKINSTDSSINTTNIQNQVDKAKKQLDDTKLLLANLDTNFQDVLNSDQPLKQFPKFRDPVKLIVKNLKEVHAILVKVIGDIKGLRVGETENSLTPTVTVVPTVTVTPTPTVTPSLTPAPTSV